MNTNKIKSAVLTGPTGVLGTALVKKLADVGVETFAACHPGSLKNDFILKHPRIHKVECDIEDIGRLPKLIGRHVDAFFHFAWTGTQKNSNRMDMYLQNTNVKYALDTVHAAKRLECKVYVGAGSQAEYGYVDGIIHPDTPVKPISGYGMAKLCAGQMTRAICHEFGIRHIWPRIISVYGENDGAKTLISTLIRTLQKGESPMVTDGEQMWDYLYADDAAEALYLMAENGRDGAIYVLGSGQTRKLKAFMMDIRDAVNKNIPLGLGKVPYLPDQVMHLEADIASLTRDTGWQPRTDFATGIHKMLTAMRSDRETNQ
ncbi:MAG: NAD-dependent epimerase/dehydratase family protein [Selenomonadaceae bacterium]|nr:NAD-dependent epimerase/dehydratase family protein [Selenomonadaceae bacterium]